MDKRTRSPVVRTEPLSPEDGASSGFSGTWRTQEASGASQLSLPVSSNDVSTDILVREDAIWDTRRYSSFRAKQIEQRVIAREQSGLPTPDDGFKRTPSRLSDRFHSLRRDFARRITFSGQDRPVIADGASSASVPAVPSAKVEKQQRQTQNWLLDLQGTLATSTEVDDDALNFVHNESEEPIEDVQKLNGIDRVIQFVQKQRTIEFGYGFGSFSRATVLTLGMALVFSVTNTIYIGIYLSNDFRRCDIRQSQIFSSPSCIFQNVIALVLLAGLVKELAKFGCFINVLRTVDDRNRELRWSYSHSFLLLPLLRFSEAHRQKVIRHNSLRNIVHPKVVIFDLILADMPLACASILSSLKQTSVLALPLLIWTALSSAFRLSRFFWNMLLVASRYQRKKYRAVRRKADVLYWCTQMQKHCALYGTEPCRTRLREGMQDLLNKCNTQGQDCVIKRAMSKHSQIYWSVMEMTAISTVRYMLDAIKALQTGQTNEFSAYMDEYKMLRLKYGKEIRVIQHADPWRLDVTPQVLMALRAIWTCKYVKKFYLKYSTVGRATFLDHRLQQLSERPDVIPRDHNQAYDMLCLNLTFGGYCLDHMDRIFGHQFKLTYRDVQTARMSMVELLCVEAFNARTFHVSIDKQSSVCFLDVHQKHFAKPSNALLMSFTDVFVLPVDMLTFDEYKTRVSKSGRVVKTTSLRQVLDTFQKLVFKQPKRPKVIAVWFNYAQFISKLTPEFLQENASMLLECYPSLKNVAPPPLTPQVLSQYFEEKLRYLGAVDSLRQTSNITDMQGTLGCMRLLVKNLQYDMWVDHFSKTLFV
ncbi:hypothetical protein RI367_004263 [Sorochytrium milnesiophthora]